MIDIRDFGMKRGGWWIEERATIPCAVTKDGQLVAFRLVDAEKLMDEKYPHKTLRKGVKIWYFNETRDREIAETDGLDDLVRCNPQVLWEHFMNRS